MYSAMPVVRLFFVIRKVPSPIGYGVETVRSKITKIFEKTVSSFLKHF